MLLSVLPAAKCLALNTLCCKLCCFVAIMLLLEFLAAKGLDMNMLCCMEIMLLSVFLAAECLDLNTLCCALLRGDFAVVDLRVLLCAVRCAPPGPPLCWRRRLHPAQIMA